MKPAIPKAPTEVERLAEPLLVAEGALDFVALPLAPVEAAALLSETNLSLKIFQGSRLTIPACSWATCRSPDPWTVVADSCVQAAVNGYYGSETNYASNMSYLELLPGLIVTISENAVVPVLSLRSMLLRSNLDMIIVIVARLDLQVRVCLEVNEPGKAGTLLLRELLDLGGVLRSILFWKRRTTKAKNKAFGETQLLEADVENWVNETEDLQH
jgi:hypothetical protein